VGARQIEQHAVAPGDGNDLHALDKGAVMGGRDEGTEKLLI
jgi:hypothetical protein